MLLHAIFRRAVKVYGLPRNPLANVDRYRVRASGDIEVFSPEEIWALVRAAASEIDGAIFLTAAFTGLRRGELLGLRWRDIDFDGLDDPGPRELRGRQADDAEVRQGPGRADGARRRVRRSRGSASATGSPATTTSSSPARPGCRSTATRSAPATRRRSRAAGLRRLRFHDLRHTFGTRMIREADIRRVQEWMGHADIQTTMKYLHYESRKEDAELVARAFATGRTEEPGETPALD